MLRRMIDPEWEFQPVHWMGSFAVYGSHVIAAVLALGMVMTSILAGLGQGAVLGFLQYSSGLVLKGQIWRLVTYGLVNPPSIGFAISLYMMARYGSELEKHFGRRMFFKFYLCLYLLTPVALTVVGFWRPTFLSGQTGALAVFVAFATLYPRAVVFFEVEARWAAGILVGIFGLMAFSARDWIGLFSLGLTMGFSFAFVRVQQGRWRLPNLELPKAVDAPKFTVVRKAEEGTTGEEGGAEEMDRLLDKIANSGIASLTAEERVRLEKLRVEMIRRKGSEGR